MKETAPASSTANALRTGRIPPKAKGILYILSAAFFFSLMTFFVKLSGDRITAKEILPPGLHYIRVALNEVPLFLKKGKSIPLCRPALRTSRLDIAGKENLTW